MKKKIYSTTALFFVLFGIHAAFGQNQPSPKMLAANELFKAQKFAEAASAYQEILQGEPQNGAAWYQLAMVRYSTKEYVPAAEAFEKNIALSNNPSAMFNLACVYSLMNNREKAVEWLTRAVNNPTAVLQLFNFNDPDLTNVKNDSRVKALAEKAERTIHPCKYSDEAKQFDFFIGEWEAFNPQGQKNGTSVIQSIADGCGILENWTDIFGSEGKSINFYDSTVKKWYQYWIGADGAPLRFSGAYRDNAVRYEGEPFEVNGKKFISRLTFFKIDDKTVRQLSENSPDEGKTWTTAYDLKYVRKSMQK